jgi:hypothetical protein
MRHVAFETLVYSYYSCFKAICVLTYSFSSFKIVGSKMTWYVVFQGRKTGVYDSWGDYSEYVIGYSGTAY